MPHEKLHKFWGTILEQTPRKVMGQRLYFTPINIMPKISIEYSGNL